MFLIVKETKDKKVPLQLQIVYMNLFEQLGVSKEIVRSLEELGFETPTEIQKEAIPLLLESNPDFIGLAQTGTGKTAAFGLPLLDVIDLRAKTTQGLVLAPTRELVQQIAEGLESFAKYLNLNVQCVYGGTAISQQIRDIKRKTPNVIIATPGRLIDLLGRGVVDLSRISNFVLDEADEMLNMGFKEEIDKILSHAGEDRSTWLFSATMPTEIKRIVNEYMTDPVEVKINAKNIVNKNISHQYALVRGRDKTEALKRVIDFNKDMFGITFCRTKMDTQRIATELLEAGYKADAINGDLSQAQRDTVMKRFKSGKIKMLIATDVAARGIDVNDLTHVVHYDMPDDLEYYTHRSGRTARAGKKGISIAFVSHSDMHRVRRIEKKLKVEFTQSNIPTQKELQVAVIENWAENINTITSDNYELTDQLIATVQEAFADLSKEELILKLAGSELEKKSKGFGTNDINMSEKNRGERKEVDPNAPKQFFISLGEMDELDKDDILDIICEQTDLKKKHIANVSVKKQGTTFQVDPKHSDGVAEKFEGLKVGGRDVRCNLDVQRSSGGGDRRRSGGGGDRRRRDDRRGGSGGGDRDRGRRFGGGDRKKKKEGGGGRDRDRKDRY